jgi:hypothetical protein
MGHHHDDAFELQTYSSTTRQPAAERVLIALSVDTTGPLLERSTIIKALAPAVYASKSHLENYHDYSVLDIKGHANSFTVRTHT